MGKLTNEANVADVVDNNTSIQLGHGSKDHRTGSETEDVDGNAERSEFGGFASKL